MIETITIKISDEIQTWIRKQKNFIGHIAKVSGAIIMSMVFTHPDIMWRAIIAILSWNHYFISFLAEFTFAIYYIHPIILREIRNTKRDELLFFGVSLDKITDYLMIHGTFSRDDIEKEFGVARYLYHDMVRVMDEVGIFVRGENNQRRVDVRLSKADIIGLLSPADEVSNIPSNSTEINTEATQTGFKRSAIE